MTKKIFFNFCRVLIKISQKTFLGICHVPSVITLVRMVKIGSDYAQNDRNELNYKFIESFF
jgi:hypothetical protein